MFVLISIKQMKGDIQQIRRRIARAHVTSRVRSRRRAALSSRRWFPDSLSGGLFPITYNILLCHIVWYILHRFFLSFYIFTPDPWWGRLGGPSTKDYGSCIPLPPLWLSLAFLNTWSPIRRHIYLSLMTIQRIFWKIEQPRSFFKSLHYYSV